LHNPTTNLIDHHHFGNRTRGKAASLLDHRTRCSISGIVYPNASARHQTAFGLPRQVCPVFPVVLFCPKQEAVIEILIGSTSIVQVTTPSDDLEVSHKCLEVILLGLTHIIPAYILYQHVNEFLPRFTALMGILIVEDVFRELAPEHWVGVGLESHLDSFGLKRIGFPWTDPKEPIEVISLSIY
jgi:hypothetical protein